MFRHIMVPVDLTHQETLQRALDCADDLAARYDAAITYVGVTSSAPTPLASNPQAFAQKLEAFAAARAGRHGREAGSHVCIVNDLPTETDDALMKAIGETGADLVVMASHVPGLVEYVWSSNGGRIASHATCSVMLVRG